MHFPLFQIFQPIFGKFSDSVENLTNFTFSRQISRFSSAKISYDLFLVIGHKFRISPYFPCFSTFPPVVSQKCVFPSYFQEFPPCFRKIHLHFTYFICISIPPTLTMMHLCITQCTYWTPLFFLMLCLLSSFVSSPSNSFYNLSIYVCI